MKTEDRGVDLKQGQSVWICGKVSEVATPSGDVKVQFMARPGYDEYARPSINAIFLCRPKGLRAWLIRKLLGK